MAIDTCRDTDHARKFHLPAWAQEALEAGVWPHDFDPKSPNLAALAEELGASLDGDPKFLGLSEEDSVVVHAPTGRLVLYVVGAGYAWQV